MDIFNQLFTRMLMTTAYIHLDGCAEARLFWAAHICSTLVCLAKYTTPVLCYTRNTSTISIKNDHLAVPRQPAEAAKTGY